MCYPDVVAWCGNEGQCITKSFVLGCRRNAAGSRGGLLRQPRKRVVRSMAYHGVLSTRSSQGCELVAAEDLSSLVLLI
jgi:hypothetical protein